MFPSCSQSERSALGAEAGGETPFRWWAGEPGGRVEVVVRRRGDGVSAGRAFPKRYAHFLAPSRVRSQHGLPGRSDLRHPDFAVEFADGLPAGAK